MKLPMTRSGIWTLAITLGFGLALSAQAGAQDASKGQQTQQPPAQQQAKPATPGQPTLAIPVTGAQEAPKLDPAEETAYKAFADSPAATSQDVDKQIQTGKDFLDKYPKSRYDEAVYNRLVNDYYQKQDLPSLYATADKAVALDPDDLDVLVLVGWVVPHSYNAAELDAAQRLVKAENYEKHALELIPNLPKPANLTDEQFAAEKNAAASQAHSGLGLVYFRQKDYATSITELQQATNIPNPDPTDLYVLGYELNGLKRYPEAAEAFQKCSQISGTLQDRCTQFAEQAKKQPAAPAQPKAPAQPATPHN